jgi:hypothetical protein
MVKTNAYVKLLSHLCHIQLTLLLLKPVTKLIAAFIHRNTTKIRENMNRLSKKELNNQQMAHISLKKLIIMDSH